MMSFSILITFYVFVFYLFASSADLLSMVILSEILTVTSWIALFASSGITGPDINSSYIIFVPLMVLLDAAMMMVLVAFSTKSLSGGLSARV